MCQSCCSYQSYYFVIPCDISIDKRLTSFQVTMVYMLDTFIKRNIFSVRVTYVYISSLIHRFNFGNANIW